MLPCTGSCHYAFIKLLSFVKTLYCFCPFLYYFNLVLINQMEWSAILACPNLMCSFNRGDIEGTNSLKVCVCMICFMFVQGLVLWTDLKKD